MKPLFLLFLAINIGLFIWGYQREQAADHKRPREHAGVGELRLLTERTAALQSDSIQKPMAQGLAGVTGETAQELMDLMVVAASEPDLDRKATEQARSETEQSALPQNDTQENSPLTQHATGELDQTVQQNAQPDKVKIVDAGVTESKADITEPEEEQAEIPIASELTAASAPACYRLGPITDAASADTLSGNLKQLGLDVEIQKKSIKKPKGYWVMFPPLESYAQAKQKLKELKKAGLSDLWLFPKGKYKNAISLGLYSRRVNAELAHKRAFEKGVTTEMLARYVDVDQHWLQFHSTKLPPVAVEAIFALQDAYPGEKIEINPCSSVVTE